MTAPELADWLVVVPARLGSTRLPEKALADLGGKPLIIRVYESIAPLRDRGARCIVATDDERILEVCKKHSAEAIMTLKTHESGSDRVAEVSRQINLPFIMNVQGDEPFLECEELVNLAAKFKVAQHADMGTLAVASRDPVLYRDPNAVKVVVGAQNEALYFSRASIPHKRDGSDVPEFHFHLGVYVYRRAALLKFVQLPPGRLERLEALEQLRALENGMRMIVEPAQRIAVNINTVDDLRAAREIFAAKFK